VIRISRWSGTNIRTCPHKRYKKPNNQKPPWVYLV
jgi:hypothetical protein